MRPLSSLTINVFLVTIASVALCATAHADEKDEVDPRVAEAMTACLANRLETGISVLAQLYAETQDPVWVFNQARCYQQNDRLEEARKRFLEFQRKNQGRDQARDARAQSYIAEIDNEIEARDKAKSPSSDRKFRIAGISSAALGVAGLIAGAVFTIKTNGLESDTEKLFPSDQGFVTDPGKQQQVRDNFKTGGQYETLQWIAYGGGAAALLAGGVLYWRGMPRNQETTPEKTTAVVLPNVIAGGAGAVFLGAF